MFREEGSRPNDARAFVHKRLLSGIKGFVTGGFNPLSGITGFLTPPKRPARATVPRSTTARPTLSGQRGKELGRDLKFGGTGGDIVTRFPLTTALAPPETPCRSPAVLDRKTGLCVRPKPGILGAAQRVFPGGETGFEPTAAQPVGDAVMGQYGAALQPGTMTIERSVCLPGMQLAKDGLCYNKGAITNSQRMWPRGRRPLLTGGDMRAIGVAARAGAKLDRTTKRLRALGMMKKLPAPRKAAPHAHAKPLEAVSV